MTNRKACENTTKLISVGHISRHFTTNRRQVWFPTLYAIQTNCRIARANDETSELSLLLHKRSMPGTIGANNGVELMKKMSDIVFIIQARLSSQRVPFKMIKPFAGSTLLDIAIDKIKQSAIVPLENIYLSVHEPVLVDIGLRHGVKVFHRSQESSRSEGEEITMIYEWWNRLDYEYCVLINACNPFLTIHTIDSFVLHYLESNSDGLFGVITKKNYFWNETSKPITPWPVGYKIMNTKYVPVTYEAAHCLYAAKLGKIGEGIWMGTFHDINDPELYPIPEQEALDIDYSWQFDLYEAGFRATMLNT